MLVSAICWIACKDEDAPAPVMPAPPSHVDEALAKIVATCSEARGTVEIRRKGQPQWERMAVGATLRERDFVRAAAGGFARIRFSGGGFVELHEGTTILVDKALSIETGSLIAVAEAGKPILVRAKDGSLAQIVATGGATFRLTPSTADGLEIAVTQGDVKVVTGDTEQPIAKGEARDLAAQRTGDLVKLITYPVSLAPGVDARFRFVPAMTVALTWRPVPEAARYHVQVAHDTEFEDLVFDADAAKPGAAYTPSAVGAYTWRVAAIDAAGRMGEFGFVRRLFLEEDEPRDLLVAPADGIKFGFAESYPRIMFSWQSAGASKTYKLVVRSAADPTTPVATTVTPNQRVEVSTLREGVYTWGVYAVHDDKQEIPIFLTPRTLIVRKQRVKAHTEKLWDTGR